jgi:hypothetical protein
MKLLALLLVLLLVVALVVAVAGWLRRAAAERQASAPWRLEEISDGELVSVRAVRPGHEPLLVGAVPFAAADFESRIEEVRAEGRYKLAALNSGRGELGR